MAKRKKKLFNRVSKSRKTSSRGKPALRLYYSLNYNYEFFSELKNLVLKSLPASRERMTRRIASLGKVSLAVLSGVFLNLDKPTAADLLIVGDNIEKRKLNNFLKSLEAEIGKEVIYAVMDKEEFEYRLGMFDRFLRVLLEGPHQILINKIGL